MLTLAAIKRKFYTACKSDVLSGQCDIAHWLDCTHFSLKAYRVQRALFRLHRNSAQLRHIYHPAPNRGKLAVRSLGDEVNY